MAGTHCQTSGESYSNFDVAIYARVYEVLKMADLDWLQSHFDVMQRYLKVDKVYLETHRDTIVAEDALLEQLRGYFAERGVRTSGGITLTVNERNRFETYCYTNPEHRAMVKSVIELTARHFDEVILDDFFFTNCKCESCIKAKGAQSWTAFRLDLMTEAAQSLVMGPARAVNPDVEVVVKYPNWYEHFQGLGFNLETQPKIFDRVYTGTQTRDPERGNQHLQAYHGYQVYRYFDALKPGANGGGWVDTGGMRDIDRYAEQLWLTLFAKAPEITLFDFRQLQRKIFATDRSAWQDQAIEPRLGVGVDFDAMMAPVRREDGTWSDDATIALAAGTTFDQVDSIIGMLGDPIGVKCYRPHHATGEDYLHNYLGMLGIPIDMGPEFPVGAGTVLLTASAKHDSEIVDKIMGQLVAGKNVVITSGLLRALQGQGEPGHRIEDIAELEVTDTKALLSDYQVGWRKIVHAESTILVPHIQYLTNDSWEEISGVTRTTGHPMLHMATYAAGQLYVLTMTDNFDDLYALPVEVLSRMREVVMGDLPVRVDGPGKVSLFLYDNNTFIVESFLPETANISIILSEEAGEVRDLLTGEQLFAEAQMDWRQQPTGEVRIDTQVGPHKYRVFRFVGG
jgi:hypothetical protein